MVGAREGDSVNHGLTGYSAEMAGEASMLKLFRMHIAGSMQLPLIFGGFLYKSPKMNVIAYKAYQFPKRAGRKGVREIFGLGRGG